MFFLRAIFWLTVVWLFMPSIGEEAPAPPPQEVREAVSAATDATATAHRVYGFCAENPEACSGDTSLWSLADRGRRLVQGWLGAAPDDAAGADPPPRPRRAPLPGDTLTADDLAPEWQGPDPRRNG